MKLGEPGTLMATWESGSAGLERGLALTVESVIYPQCVFPRHTPPGPICHTVCAAAWPQSHHRSTVRGQSPVEGRSPPADPPLRDPPAQGTPGETEVGGWGGARPWLLTERGRGCCSGSRSKSSPRGPHLVLPALPCVNHGGLPHPCARLSSTLRHCCPSRPGPLPFPLNIPWLSTPCREPEPQ